MRVMHVINGSGWGGAYQIAAQICAWQCRRGIEAVVCLLGGGDAKSRVLALGAPLLSHDSEHSSESKRARWSDLQQGHDRIVKEWRPDVISTHMPLSHLLTQRFVSRHPGAKWVAVVHQSWRMYGHRAHGSAPWLKYYMMLRHGLGDAFITSRAHRVVAVSDAIRRSRAGLADPRRPYGSFLFLGPTGVGKTELCKALAEFLFDAEDHLIRIDMSEFMEKHSVARLIGAPPGYVGYEEGGYLTEAVRRKPYSVILLDEIEKAHADVFNVLLQVLDDGRMTDGQGRTVDFKNTVVVMTSNLGSPQIQQMAGDDYQVIKLAVLAEVKAHFRPEFVNRIDEIVVFHALDEKHIKSIARIQLGFLEKRLAGLEIKLEVSDAALREIASAGFDPIYGARPLKRAIQARIENPLAKAILEGEFGPKDTVRVDARKGAIVFEKAQTASAAA